MQNVPNEKEIDWRFTAFTLFTLITLHTGCAHPKSLTANNHMLRIDRMDN